MTMTMTTMLLLTLLLMLTMMVMLCRRPLLTVMHRRRSTWHGASRSRSTSGSALSRSGRRYDDRRSCSVKWLTG
jgi:hypothetical protein